MILDGVHHRGGGTSAVLTLTLITSKQAVDGLALLTF